MSDRSRLAGKGTILATGSAAVVAVVALLHIPVIVARGNLDRPLCLIGERGGTVIVESDRAPWPLQVLGNSYGRLFDRVDAVCLGGTRAADDDLALVARIPHLRGLDLHDTSITDAGIRHLVGTVSLAMLSLRNTDVTDSALQSINGLRALESLDLRDTRVSSGGLHHLRALVRLRELYLDRTQVDDAGIADLECLGTLEVVSLRDCRVTSVGAEHLSKALPNAVVLGPGAKAQDPGGFMRLHDTP